MKLIDKKYVEENKQEILEPIKAGKIFIYPTDTIYGIGCNALDTESVHKVREIKNRPDNKPFSIIAPSKDWIVENCEVEKENLNKYLPGPYTLFLRKRQNCKVSEEVNPNMDTLGIRIPDHWFAKVVEESGVPFVTTSVNISGEQFMKKLDDVPQQILDQVDYVIYEGVIDGEPSIKIDLTNSTKA